MFDNKIKKMLGNKPKTLGNNVSLGLNSTGRGASVMMQNKWKNMSPLNRERERSRLVDSDGDRVPNKYDCSPFNIMKQDSDEMDYLLREMNNCDDCLKLKLKGVIPGCCQYHINKQFELKK